MDMLEIPFWKRVKLADMTREQWESLCDGCGKCCLEKLEDMDNGELAFTNVACRMLDIRSCRCKDYENRTLKISECIELTPTSLMTIRWLPSTCAYRLLREGRDLPVWHPLVTGDAESVHRARQSVRGRAVAEKDAGDLEDHIVSWPE
ncbi:YcgN family cysteine cluster protein [Magnetospira thiophila]